MDVHIGRLRRALNLRGADFQAFVADSVDSITTISKEIGLIQ